MPHTCISPTHIYLSYTPDLYLLPVCTLPPTFTSTSDVYLSFTLVFFPTCVHVFLPVFSCVYLTCPFFLLVSTLTLPGCNYRSVWLSSYLPSYSTTFPVNLDLSLLSVAPFFPHFSVFFHLFLYFPSFFSVCLFFHLFLYPPHLSVPLTCVYFSLNCPIGGSRTHEPRPYYHFWLG